ncbi:MULTISPECIES: carbohydrate porin [Methylobacterium]|uniref:carbohydrate porin n=1 Tax=Methylobacterium TaxID=407 RepID=UPI0013EAAB06|nr:carbohydrate porin [Methylobacterium sp. DB0501]NGM37967.1 porin [Methylobacterium sp. DB0501]
MAPDRRGTRPSPPAKAGRGRARLRVVLPVACLALGPAAGLAQIVPPAADPPDTPERPATRPATPRGARSDEDAERHGPLAAWATETAAQGLTFDINAYSFFSANPTLGLRPGRHSHAGYLVLSMNADLERFTGVAGGTITITQSVFGLVRNLHMADAIGDSVVGYQPAYNPFPTRLSLLTYQQRLLDDRLVVEIGRTHPDRYYALPPCGTTATCYQSLLALNAGWTSSLYGVWGANAAYKPTPSTYVQAGIFSVNPDTNRLSGTEWGTERIAGATVMTEAGFQTDYAISPYPGRVSLTGFVNTADHDDSIRTIAGLAEGLGEAGVAFRRSGTSGVVLTASKTVWRADGGADAQARNPTALTVYSSTGLALDTTVPVRFHSFAGLLLSGPDRDRPDDTYGFRLGWQQLNPAFAAFLGEASRVSGGSGQAYPRDKLVFEANARFELGQGIGFEPVIQYVVNADSFYEPYTARRARDGVFVGAALVVPLGTMLGLTAE